MMENAGERQTDGAAEKAEAGDPVAASPSLPARPARARSRPIDAAARDRIGRGLRLHYAGVLAQPIPDRLRTLLDDLTARADTEAQP